MYFRCPACGKKRLRKQSRFEETADHWGWRCDACTTPFNRISRYLGTELGYVHVGWWSYDDVEWALEGKELLESDHRTVRW